MSKVITQEEFVSKVKAIHGNDYEILSEYNGWHGKVKVRHKCGHEYEIKASSLYKKTDCRFCSEVVKEGHKIRAQKRSTGLEKFKQKVYDLVKNEYTVLGDKYINNKTPIEMKHNTCGHEYTVRPNDFQQGYRCPECAKKKRIEALTPFTKLRKKENYLENLLLDDPEYEWLEEYTGNNKDLHKIKHNTCGHEYTVRPNDFQQGYRCPNCSNPYESKASKYIKCILNENKINYRIEVTFDGCVNKMKLPFDFMINDFIIEYDGTQHFNVSDLFGKDNYVKTKYNDRIKNRYMIKQGKYKFLRLHYGLKHSEIKKIILAIANNNFDLSLVFKYNLFYADRDSIINRRSYYENINENYFTEEV